MVSYQDFYVSNENTAGWYWLKLTVEDTIFSDADSLMVEVNDAYSCS